MNSQVIVSRGRRPTKFLGMVEGDVYYYNPHYLKMTSDGRVWIGAGEEIYKSKKDWWWRKCVRKGDALYIRELADTPILTTHTLGMFPVCIDKSVF